MTVLVDTCIIVDALASRVPFAHDAQELLLRGGEKRVTLFVSAKSFLDLHYILKHYLNDETKVRSKLSDLLQALSVVNTAGPSVVAALNSPTTDYEDAVQIETALSEGVDYIATRDKTGFSKSLIPAKTAGELLTLLDQGSDI